MERLKSLDAVFLAIENPVSPMNVGSVGVFEGPAPSIEDVRAFVDAKVADIDRCRQRVHEMWGHLARPVWVDDDGFDVAHHVRHIHWAKRSRESIDEFVELVMSWELDRSRPLWEVWLVEGFADGRWYLVSKIHHAMADGIAGSDLLSLILDDQPGSSIPGTPRPRALAPSGADVALFSAVELARSARTRLRRMVESITSPRETYARARHVAVGARGLWLTPSHRHSPLTGPIGRTRRWAHGEVSLDDVAEVREHYGGTLNDVVLAGVAAGFRELLISRGVEVAGRSVMAMVPVSTRGVDEHGQLDNRVAVTHALLPVDEGDLVVLHGALRRQLADLKISHQSDASTRLLHVGDVTPQLVADAVARGVVRLQRNLETVVTNVPGPSQPLYLGPRRMLGAHPVVPIAGQIRIAVGVWSYCGTLYFGVTADRASVSDLDVLMRGILDAVSSLVRSARRPS